MSLAQHENAKVVLLRAVADLRTDDELALLAARGNRSAFEQLVRRHQGSSLGVAARYLGDASLARDAVQSAFLEVYRGLGRYQPRGRFAFWLRRVVLNQARQQGRSARIRERVTEAFSTSAENAGGSPSPEEWVAARQRRAVVDVSLLRLSEKLREVVVLRYAGGHSIEEIAELLELPLGTVKSRLFNAMAALKDHLGATP